jgi:hypothetical protein
MQNFNKELNAKILDKQIQHSLMMQRIKDVLGLRKSRQDSFKVTPRVAFFEGTPERPIRHITSGRGRLVSQGLIGLADYMGIGYYSNNYCGWMYQYGVGGSGIPVVPSIRLGTGTTATLYNTSQLQTIISTPPNTATGSISNPSAGIYRVTCNATWNAGTIGTPTITEAALYANSNNVLQPFGAGNVGYAVMLVDRVCSTDGDFNSFAANATKPLTVQYQVQVQFA